MKKLLVCVVLLCFLISCSTDSDFNVSESQNISRAESIEILLPENKANPFDYRGKEFYKILSSYRQQNQFPNSIGEVTNQIRFISNQLGKGTTTSKNIIYFDDAIVESIMADPDNSMIQIVQSSSLGSAAKASLINFLQDLIAQRQLDFNITYDYIVTYEDTVLANNTLSEDEMDTLLTVTSISRYSLYSESERRDRDWENTAGNKLAKSFFTTNEVSVISIIALLQKII